MKKIPFNVPWKSSREEEYLKDVINRGSFAGNGHYTKECQRLLEDLYDVDHVFLTTSCTAALELSSIALDIGPGDEVIVPSYTFVSTASAYLRSGARIVFADIHEDTLMIDVEDVESKITDKTRVIVPVHYGGWSADMDELTNLCQVNEIDLVEDSAQGLGSSIGGEILAPWVKWVVFHFMKPRTSIVVWEVHCSLMTRRFLMT